MLLAKDNDASRDVELSRSSMREGVHGNNNNFASKNTATRVHGGEIFTSEDVSDYKPPYKILWPGYYSGESKDPRIGRTAGFREILSERCCGGYSFEYNEDDEVDDEMKHEDESDDDFSEGEIVYVDRITVRTVKTFEEAEALGIYNDPSEGRNYRRDWTKRLKEDEENEAEAFKIRDCRCAEDAIKFYNNKHGTDYEIVETLGSYMGIVCGIWIHCNFKAQRKSESHSSPKLFFAESYNDRGVRRPVNSCDIIDDRKHHVLGCSICPYQLWHPSRVEHFVKRVEEIVSA